MSFSGRDRYGYTRPPRSLARKVLIVFNIVLAAVLVVLIASAGYVVYSHGRLPKLGLDALRDGGSSTSMNVLLVGSDSRADLEPGETKSFGDESDAAGQRADTIMILHVDSRQTKASVLSIPRDTWVTNSATASKTRINDAFQTGPNDLISTITSNFNIPIDHYAQVNFDGFKGIVDSIGGVEIRFDAPARDRKSGLNIPQTGCVKLNGDQALAYARSRFYETKLNGRWVSDPRSDLSRIDRQQDFIRRVLRKSVSSASNPLTLNAIVNNGVKNVTIDKEFGTTDIIRIARRFRSLDPNTVEMMTLPTKPRNVGGADVLVPELEQVNVVVDRFLHGPPSADEVANIPPNSISLRVLNGSGVDGQAADAAGSLRDAGFVVSGTGDGTKRNSTVVQYASGNKDKAEVIARYLGGSVTTVEDRTVRGVDAIVATGSSFEGVIDPSAPTTSTEAPQQSTTSTTASPFVPSGDC